MAIVVPGGAYPVDFRIFNVANLLWSAATTKTSTLLVLSYANGGREEFTGSDLAFNAAGEPISGVLTGYALYQGGALAVGLTGASASVVEFMAFVKAGNSGAAVSAFLSGDDTVNGSAFADYLVGGAGADVLFGNDGNDSLFGNAGNDIFNGGAGADIALYNGISTNFTLTRNATGWLVSDTSGAVGTDTLIDVERIGFSDKIVDLSAVDATVTLYVANLLRGTADTGVSTLVANGLKTPAEALTILIKQAGSTTSVATLSYQFFTGKIPGEQGIDYLVSPTGPNPNNLNSAYYQAFSLENRYINFSVNLGKVGEGAAKFTSDYGALSLFDATKKAYATIFGVTPTDEKVHALLDPTSVLNGQVMSRADYFAYYGGDGLGGVGTKAAMVGWLLGEAVKADIGLYAKSNDAFLTDLSDGASFAVNLVAVYGKAEFSNF